MEFGAATLTLASPQEFTNVLARVSELEPTWGVDPWDLPSNVILKMSDVRMLKTGNVRCIYVLEPQGYDSITRLDLSHMMFKNSENDYGYFYVSESEKGNSPPGAACSGSGCDAWYLVNDEMYRWLLTKLGKLKQANAQARLRQFEHHMTSRTKRRTTTSKQ